MTCLECGMLTDGSRGPVSGYLRPLCPGCGDKADREALQACVAQARVMDRFLDDLAPKPVQELGEVG